MKRTLLNYILALTTLLSACRPASTPAPTLTPDLISECFLRRTAQVWIDEDIDGVPDPDEPPLPGVSVTIFPIGRPNRTFYAQTGPNGIADINGIGDFGRYCDELEAEVTIPTGYTPSTPARLNLSGVPPTDTLWFGLVALTPTPEPTQPGPRQLATLYAPMDPLPVDGCPFVSNQVLENSIGTLTQPPNAMVVLLPPHYEERASVRCEARSENNTAFIDVWFAPDAASAQADFKAIADLVGAEAVVVSGLGESALWWPRGLRLETVWGDTRATISLAVPLSDSANQAAALAASALKIVNPDQATSPSPIEVSAEASVPSVVHLSSLEREGQFFEACSLLSRAEFEETLGSLEQPLLSGSSIGELGPQAYECMTDPHEPDAWMYFSLIFGGMPGDAILNYWRDSASRPANAVQAENLGDEAWLWLSDDGASLNVSVLRGNVTLTANLLIEDTSENRATLQSLARLILERLFEFGASSTP